MSTPLLSDHEFLTRELRMDLEKLGEEYQKSEEIKMLTCAPW